jgi:hypothetical protein
MLSHGQKEHLLLDGHSRSLSIVRRHGAAAGTDAVAVCSINGISSREPMSLILETGRDLFALSVPLWVVSSCANAAGDMTCILPRFKTRSFLQVMVDPSIFFVGSLICQNQYFLLIRGWIWFDQWAMFAIEWTKQVGDINVPCDVLNNDGCPGRENARRTDIHHVEDPHTMRIFLINIPSRQFLLADGQLQNLHCAERALCIQSGSSRPSSSSWYVDGANSEPADYNWTLREGWPTVLSDVGPLFHG